MTRLSGTIDEGAGAFVQLRDSSGDFVGEVRADDDGRFLFHTIPGHWMVICLTAGPRRRTQEVDLGSDDVDIRVPA